MLIIFSGRYINYSINYINYGLKIYVMQKFQALLRLVQKYDNASYFAILSQK